MQPKIFSISANFVDISNQKIFAATVVVNNNTIESITPINQIVEGYILPGFIDSHVHIESSMLVPSEFAKLAVVHGTVATISDPHEIANICGVDGVLFMIDNGNKVNFKFNFGAPSCVPATIFETAGATITTQDVENLLQRKDIKYLTEMMNFPGVLNNDAEVLAKIAAANNVNKPVDGHAPGLRGAAAQQYINAGISTDHECFTIEEATDKLSFGMKILIREGSAAKNFEALIPLLNNHSKQIMFCSDDKHPDSLELGHINQLCARAVAKGINVFNVLQAACINPVEHYNLDVGLLQVGDAADFIVVNNLTNFIVNQTYINGELVAENKKSFIKSVAVDTINNFNCNIIEAQQLAVPQHSYPTINNTIPVIEALEGQLITNKLYCTPTIVNYNIVSNISNDILKIVVVNRYNNAPIAKAFIKNFGLQKGAIASSVAHDSHNIVAVGVDDESLTKAINYIIENRGGISVATQQSLQGLQLPIAGLMTSQDGYAVAAAYTKIDAAAKQLGSQLAAPFMTLSFMALLVIPHLKLSDKGLFDGDTFSFIEA
jgi:adenine deaminase